MKLEEPPSHDVQKNLPVAPTVGPYFVPVVLLSLAAFGAACGAVIGSRVRDEIEERSAKPIASSPGENLEISSRTP